MHATIFCSDKAIGSRLVVRPGLQALNRTDNLRVELSDRNNSESKLMKKLVVIGLALAAAGALSAHAGDAKETFEKDCAKCHGVDGKGDTKMGKKLEIKDLTDAKIQGTKDADLAKAIKEGIKDGDKVRMKAFADLSDDEVKALVAYVHNLKK